jgi:hypothetical protein
MGTFLVFTAVVAAAIVIFLGLLAAPRVRRAASRFAQRLAAVGVFVFGAVSAIADFVLSRRNGRIAWWKYAVWTIVGLVPLGLFAASTTALVADAIPPRVPLGDVGFLLVAAGLFQALMLAAALLIAREDYDVMDGIVADARRRIGGPRSAKRLPVVAISLALFFIYAVAVAWWLGEVEGVDLLARRPDTGFIIVDYVLVALWSLPTSFMLRAIDWSLGANTEVAFTATLVARAYHFTTYGIGTLLLAGFVGIILQFVWQVRRIVTELGEGREGEHQYLMTRARLAPPAVKHGILAAAVSTQDSARQRRLIEATRDIGICTFPQEFCRHLPAYDEGIQRFGLERALELYRQRVPDFARESCEATLRRAAHHLHRGKLGNETLKRMVRLMVAILATKREVVRLDERLKKSILDAIARELNKPRAESDPAFRGLLQDLRGGITRLGPPKPPIAAPAATDWVKRLAPAAEDRAAAPGSPAPTVR